MIIPRALDERTGNEDRDSDAQEMPSPRSTVAGAGYATWMEPAPATEQALQFFLHPGLPLKAELERIVQEQLRDAAQALRIDSPGADDRGHVVRSLSRKLRACCALIRSVDEDRFEKQKVSLRRITADVPRTDAARRLLSAYEQLLPRYRPELEPYGSLLQELRAAAAAEAAICTERPDTETWNALHADLADCSLRYFGEAGAALDADTVLDGFSSGYRAARKAYARADSESSAEAFDAWRKATRIHRVQVQLLRCAWPTTMNAWRKELKALETLLGEERDLRLLDTWSSEQDAADARHRTLRLIVEHRAQRVRRAAVLQARRLFAEKPKLVRERIANWWEIACERSAPQRVPPVESGNVPHSD